MLQDRKYHAIRCETIEKFEYALKHQNKEHGFWGGGGVDIVLGRYYDVERKGVPCVQLEQQGYCYDTYYRRIGYVVMDFEEAFPDFKPEDDTQEEYDVASLFDL